MAYRPLADEIRPTTLSEVVGQSHILGKQGLLTRIIQGNAVPNLIFYGPSGTGKTTVANLIAQKTNRPLHRLNATTATLSDIKEALAEVGTLMAPEGVLIYLDEIQYFNKKQQQSLLEFMENGKMTLIASTTENPFFYVFGAVLSRSSVFEFRQITPEEALPAICRGFSKMGERIGSEITLEEGVAEQVAFACGGDLRKGLNAIELLASAGAKQADGSRHVSLEDCKIVGGHSAMQYDKNGEAHYDILSGLQKSIRGSDPHAAVHYLGRLMEAGDLLSACRRLMVIACEDVGLANPQVIPVVKACVDAATMLGLPEGRIPLADAAVLMATSPKSNSGYLALDSAMADIRGGNCGTIPRHLQNVHADSAGLEQAQGYLYPHDFPNHWVAQTYLPQGLEGRIYYEYGENKLEQAAKQYWDQIKKPPTS